MVDFDVLDFDGVSSAQVPEQVRQAIHAALQAVCDDDPSVAAKALRELADSGDGALFLACVTWARVWCRFHPAAQGLGDSGSDATQALVDPDGQRADNSETVVTDRDVWVRRMMAAALNQDRTMLTALFVAVQKRPDLIGNYVAGVLLQAAAALEGSQ